MTPNRLINRNVTSARGRTSIRLEPEFWDALSEYCARKCITPYALIRDVDEDVGPGNRTSKIRLRLVQYFREAATEAGHVAAGHGEWPEAEKNVSPPS